MKIVKKTYLLLIVTACLLAQSSLAQKKPNYFSVKGTEVIAPNGKPFLMRGTNLGNWLNPEGYMFMFDKVSSFRLIDQLFKELYGPSATNRFWQRYQDNYITREDIHYIKQMGANSIRIPFHYKLFTAEDYMGANNPNRGFELLDRVIGWCKAEGLYVILDMHDAPGGQTGDNIDDSYGYPWIFESEPDQQLYCKIWSSIAKRYANEPTVIGYDLLNEPIAHYFSNKDDLNKQLEPLYIRVTKAIRTVDKNHIVICGGAQWDGNTAVFSNFNFDEKMMYTCHRYWCDTLQSNIQDFLDFRAKSGRPIYMGETGENKDEWVAAFRTLLEKNNIGWHFWPYKKMPATSGVMIVKKPENWDLIVEYSKKDRSSLGTVRDNQPDRQLIKNIPAELIENIKFRNCSKNEGYIKALGLKP